MKQPIAEEPTPRTDEELLDELQRRAVLYFWEKADADTGLVNDRAKNFEADHYTVASTAVTGYGLAALPIGVERGWLNRSEAAARARKTLRFLRTMPHQRGWLTHFIDRRNGQRLWESEFSSIDTALLVAGAIVCGQYFARDISTIDISVLADDLYRRIDWWWMLTNNGAKPDKSVLSHGWKPETGFISYDYGAYSKSDPDLLARPRGANSILCQKGHGKRSSVPYKPMGEPNRSKEAPSSFIKCHQDFSIFVTSGTSLALTIGYHRQTR